MNVLRSAGILAGCILAGSALAESPKDSWIKSLAVQLKAHRHYPLESSGTGGTARVIFHIDRSGQLISAALLESTGDRALDKEALTMIERAQPFPAPPPDMSDDHLTLSVPLVFAPRPASAINMDIAPDPSALRAKLNGICRGC
ncbi:hypothetical protein; putative signal peptide [Bradyrhizobium sp. ORS 278]|uniref:energy transducer TonB family protein n=1 Tax=Bradyrhizobium sp. (strain ORS 278) TaxID=114615 RepID=UPI000150768D|nr:energy transducer TonB [Bradyrhizobium sp. ORS 278]CAL74964.1 hypothetical protein; putative signal peptide [Bradyrhizobium sp. ORS 278]